MYVIIVIYTSTYPHIFRNKLYIMSLELIHLHIVV